MAPSVNPHTCSLELKHLWPNTTVTILIPCNVVDVLYEESARIQKNATVTPGFEQGNVPTNYIKHNFHATLVEHLQEFLLHYSVIGFLYDELLRKKVAFAGEPRLLDITIKPGEPAQYTFSISTLPSVEIKEWKYLPFKAPQRKKYKDLDRQVDDFVKEEKELLKNHTNDTIKIGDWVNFTIAILNNNKENLLNDDGQNVWLRIGEEEVDQALAALFIGKKVGDTFCTRNKDLQAYFSEYNGTDFTYCITISDILHSTYFCFDLFKKQFRLKTNKDMFKKLIEVFSYRNDLSQRRQTAENALKLLKMKHHFDVPTHMRLRQQEKLLFLLKQNPDYHVYRMQKDFKRRVQELAEKQLRELILLDLIAFNENVTTTNHDIKQYLNLLNRPRMKEFIYFDPPITKIKGQELPITAAQLKQDCLREKTLNYIIYHLTKD